MKPDQLLPAIVFGLTNNGYDIIGKAEDLSPVDINAFLGFAKAVSWRPAKLKEKEVQGTALVPCPGGVFACRLSETSPDTYGRQMAMCVEGILCPAEETAWCSWLEPENWPSRTIQAPYMVRDIPEKNNDNTVLPDNWNPESNQPLVLIPPHLINMPQTWNSQKQQNTFRKNDDSKPTAAGNHKTIAKGRPAMNSSLKKKSSNWTFFGTGFGSGILIMLIAGYLTLYSPIQKKIQELESETRQWRIVSEQTLSVSSPEKFQAGLESLALENDRLKKEIQAWIRSARTAGNNVSTPETLYIRIEKYQMEIDKLGKGVSPEDRHIISQAAQYEPLIQRLKTVLKEWESIDNN